MSKDKKTLWQQKLAQSRMQLRSVLTRLTDEQWQAEVYSEGQTWTVTNVVAHLAESETGMSIQVHKVRQGQETVPEGFDLDRWNAGLTKRTGDISPEELLHKLAEVRTRTLQEMDTLKDEEWALTGRHPSQGVITIEQYYKVISGHEVMHAQDIATAIEA